MIIFNISGGLGNQFFQYAFGRYLAVKNNTDLFIYQKSFNTDVARRPVLGYFNTKYRIATEENIASYENQYLRLHPYLKKHYRKPGMAQWKRYFNDSQNPGFHAQYRRAVKGYFHGYWANENYFKEIKEQLLKEFMLKHEFKTEGYHSLERQIQESNSIAVHIRRGDYVSNPDFGKIFNVLDPAYYLHAIAQIAEVVVNPVFYFFSDDPDWVADTLAPKVKGYCQIISDQLQRKDYLEFSLMKNCKHFIIANSTFSWWAAWLSQHSSKMVFAPKDWYTDPKRQFRHETDSFLPAD
jgi:hypothetical protein